MKKAASSILRDLEIRVTHLEKSASQVEPEFVLQTWGENGQPIKFSATLVSCALTQKALLECAKRKLGVECWFDEYRENLVTSDKGLTLWLWCANYEQTGIKQASFTLKNKYGSYKVKDVLPLS